jgi:hypothetical protein
MTDLIKESIDIPVYKISYLKEKIEKLNRKAVKMGCSPMVLSFDNEHVIDYNYHPLTGVRLVNPIKIEMVTAHLEYIIPIIEGYELVATLDLFSGDSGSEVLISAVPDKVVPDEWKNATSIKCDHCGWTRNRNHSILLKHTETGEYKEVGSTCVKDFFGLDPKGFMLMASIKFHDIIGGISEETAFGSSVNHGYDLMSVLVLSAACIAKWGWLSKGKAWELNNAYENAHYVSTASHVEQNLDPDPRMDEADKVYVEQEDIDLAEKALAYFKELDPENNDYLLNITKIVKIGYVPYKYIGYACSMVSTYNREMEKKIKAEKKAKENADCPSSFQGVLNERLKGIRVVVTYKRYFENDFGSNTLYAFKDALGNVYKTFYSGSSWEAEVDEKLIIDGTVKKHNTFNGIEETMLNRVAVKSAPDEIFSVDEFKVA